MPTASSSVHPTEATMHAAEAAVYCASHTAAMHAAAKTGLAAEGVLRYDAAMVKAVKNARVPVWRRMRCDKSTITTMIESSRVIKVMTMETVGTKSIMAVYKGRTPRNEVVMVENYESVPPVETPCRPSPVKTPYRIPHSK